MIFEFLLSVLFITHVAAYKFDSFSVYGEGFINMRACSNTLFSQAAFCENQTATSYACFCENRSAMASMAGCISVLNSNPHSVFEWFASYCGTQSRVAIREKDLVESLNHLKVHGKELNPVGEVLESSNSNTRSNPSGGSSKHAVTATSKAAKVSGNSPERIDFPIYVNQTLAIAYFDAYSSSLGNVNWAYWYSDAIYGYWLLVFTIAAVTNWSVAIFPGLRNSCNGRISKIWRKYVTLPALIKKKKTNHQEILGVSALLVPSRLETIILMGFFGLTFLFNALHMDWKPSNPIYATRNDAILRYVADRTGIVGVMLLPLLILIGGRNNFLQWITRWKFSTFVLYHRWIGRVIVTLVFIHAVGFSVRALNAQRYATLIRTEYIIYGVVSVVAGCIICFQGLLFLRRQFYEVFLAVHILLAVAFLVGAWKHIEMRMFMEWLIAAVTVWSLDRFVRIARIIWFGAPKATVTLLADDCLRVTVPKPAHWPSVPGGHAWVYFCHSWFFWQSHPFTFLNSTAEENKIVFILKTKKGATHYVSRMLASIPEKTASLRVCVEGPYGEACSVKAHDNVVFVAGGNGIPGIFSECYSLATKSASNARQRIKLIWIIREISTIEWVWEELHSLKRTKVQATVYITRPQGGKEQILLDRMASHDDSSSDEKGMRFKEGRNIFDLLNDHFPHITFKYGRPSMDAVVDEETEEAVKSAAFITCGHPVMVDDLRYAVVQKIDKTEKRVDFFEQLQVWA